MTLPRSPQVGQQAGASPGLYAGSHPGPHPSGHLLFVGQAVLDHVFLVDELSATAGKAEAQGYRSVLAGLSANAACAAQRLRDPAHSPGVVLVSAVGDDAAGEAVLRVAVEQGFAGVEIARIAAATTSVSAVWVAPDGERQVRNVRGTALARAPLPDAALLPGCVGLLTDPRWPAAAAWALSAARAAGIPSVLDAEQAPRADLQALVGLADWCVFSSAGLAAWAGEDRVATALALDAALGATLGAVAMTAPHAELVVTLGAEGALWRRPSGALQHLPAFKVSVQNTNGAGDVMHGALLLMLAERKPPALALRWAMAAAAQACTGAVPDREAWTHFLARNS